MITKKIISIGVISLVLGQSLTVAIADEASLERRNRSYPAIYPFVPMELDELQKSAKLFTEDKSYIGNIFEAEKLGLISGKTHERPWTSTYWPLNKGLIADSYTSKLGWNPFRYHREVSWQANYQRLKKRISGVQAKWQRLSQKELDILAPSEKYDILMGDNEFHLTSLLREYMFKWGSKKEHGFLSKLDVVGGGALELAKQMVANGQNSSIDAALPAAINLRGGLADKYAALWVKNGQFRTFEEALPSALEKARSEEKSYVLKEKNVLMGLWEGICHGWSTAAGVIPRPTGTATFILPNGRRLNFYPSDIKGLVSLTWANSIIQDSLIVDGRTDQVSGGGVIMQGLRCNDDSAETDEWGRYYDAKPDPYSRKLESRCAGVHPALWHIALTNLIGKQGRSFVVERKISEQVDNHPMYSYTGSYFNPYTGKYGSLNDTLRPLTNRDQFFKFRNQSARYIVGVKMEIRYIDWERPNRSSTDAPSMDKTDTQEMLYDLELDANGNIVGGQWRADEVGKPTWLFNRANRNQPDFFWVITKDWQKFFPENGQISKWNDTNSLPPTDWLAASRLANDFVYQQTAEFGWNEKCTVINKRSGKAMDVPCEYKINKPQPLVNVINVLIKKSRGEM